MARKQGVEDNLVRKIVGEGTTSQGRVAPNAKVTELCKHGKSVGIGNCLACAGEADLTPIKTIPKTQFEYDVLELGLYPSDMRQALNTAADDNWRLLGVAQRGSITIAFLERERKTQS